MCDFLFMLYSPLLSSLLSPFLSPFLSASVSMIANDLPPFCLTPPLTHFLLPYTKDERIRSLDQLPRYGSHASVLTKMYTEQILRREELTIFEASLMPHQKAVSSCNAILFVMLNLLILSL